MKTVDVSLCETRELLASTKSSSRFAERRV
jgi:hypothetical protein